MNTYSEERKRQTQERKNTVVEREESEAIAEFFRRNLKIVVLCQANTERVINYFAGDPITLEALEEAFNSHPAFRASLALQTEAHSRARLEKEIEDLLTGASSPLAVAEQLKSIRFKTTEALVEWRDRLAATKAARSKSAAELRAEIQAARTKPEQDLPPDISKEQILHLWDAATFRSWAKRLGSFEPINRRINQKD
jgi:hypothetical protein